MKIEICAASFEALKGAVELEVDRVEVCSCLEQGGVSPSTGFIEISLDLGLNTHVLVRPRAGGFVYSQDEKYLVLKDIKCIDQLGVHGVVFGALNPNLRIDRLMMQEVRDRCRGELTFHRAFDDLVEWQSELDWLAENGVTRILSSGLATTVTNGIPTLAEMVDYAAGRIEIMAGGGINLANIPKVLEKVNPSGIHFSATVKETIDPSSFFSEDRLVFDANKAKKMVELCRNCR